MGKLRTPFLILALLLIFVIVLIERSALSPQLVGMWVPQSLQAPDPTTLVGEAIRFFSAEQQQELDALRNKKQNEVNQLPSDLSGFGVESLQFVDSFLLFSIALMTLALLLPEYIQAKIQGILTLIFAILLILAAIIKVFVVLAKLITMVAMLLSFPFGTLAYLIIFGSFPSGAANAVLSFLFFLKILFVVLLVLAHERFLQNLGLVVFVIVSFVANILVTLLYGIVPGFLVSITDAIAAIIVIIIGIILAIVMAVFAILAIILALKPA
ncbi:MAG: hypothetical protein KDE48_01665 [Anaerolineales bacterium]|nr:hypothetical protein [Anaerolineales bacterium]